MDFSVDWVVGHLSNLGLVEHFDAICCGDEVTETKPKPALYLNVLQACIAIPNALTRQLSLSLTDFQMSSLADLPLQQILYENLYF
jgi:hypothetical protein